MVQEGAGGNLKVNNQRVKPAFMRLRSASLNTNQYAIRGLQRVKVSSGNYLESKDIVSTPTKP